MNQRQITEKSLMEKKLLREAGVSAAVLKDGQVSLCTHPQLPKNISTSVVVCGLGFEFQPCQLQGTVNSNFYEPQFSLH